MKIIKKHFLYIWSLFIAILTLVPTPEYTGTVETYYDKVAHVFMFGIFSYLLFGAQKNKKKSIQLFLCVVGGVLYSLLIEFLQLFVPGRDANHLDFIAGLVGIISFSFIAYARKN